MIRFEPAPHTSRPGDVIEIWEDSDFIGAIYPVPGGIKVISKHPKAVDQNSHEVTVRIHHKQQRKD